MRRRRRNPSISRTEMETLALAYTEGRDLSGSAWGQSMARAYADKVQRDFRRLTKKVRVEFTSRDPYRSVDELSADVLGNHHMWIYTGGSDTPLWSPQVNWMARAVHDYDHVTEHADFTLPGELRAYRKAVSRDPQFEPLALSEIALQAAVSTVSGSFSEGKQKFVVPSSSIVHRIVASRNGSFTRRDLWTVQNAAAALGYMTPAQLMKQLATTGMSFDRALVLVTAAKSVARAYR